MTKVTRLLIAILLGVTVGLFVQTAYGKGGLSDEELKNVSEEFDRAIQRYDDWLSRMYELTPDQQQQVRKHLQALKESQIEWGPNAEKEMQEISKEMRYYIEQSRQGKSLDKQKVQELQDRMVGLVEKAPLSMNSVVGETEKLLPPQQVQAGRERIREHNERIHEMAERQKAQLAEYPATDVDLLKQYWKPEDQVMAESRRRMEGGGAAPETPTKPVTPNVPVVTSRPVAPASAPASAPAEMDDWTRYVQTFIDKYQLDDRQKQQGWQIHGELQKRADEYRMTHKSDYEAVKRIENKGLAAQELKDLNKPILDMFAELKTRLNNIPTDEQRKMAEAAKPARGPATQKAVTSAPASGPSSQPAKAAASRNVKPPKATASRPAKPAAAPAATR